MPTITAVVIFDEPTEYHRADYETASAWTKYVIQPGEYPVEFVTIDYRPTPEGERGYFGQVVLDVQQVKDYYENRLWNANGFACSAQTKETPDAPVTQLSRSTYAFQFEGSHLPARDSQPARDIPPITTFYGGRVEYR